MKIKNLTCLAALAVAGGISAADIELPKPETTGGMPLQEALANRRTDRKFSSKPLSREMLSNLLWSALGVNRADGKRTAPRAGPSFHIHRPRRKLRAARARFAPFRFDRGAPSRYNLFHKLTAGGRRYVLFLH